MISASGPGSSPGLEHFVARHVTLTVPLSTPVYKWVPANKVMIRIRTVAFSIVLRQYAFPR